MSKIELPPLPEPFDYCYEWDGPYGSRKFSMAPHNGRRPDRSVPIYRGDQLRARDRQIVELCASLCDALSDEVDLIPPSNLFARGRMQGMWDCAAAIRALLDEKKGDDHV